MKDIRINRCEMFTGKLSKYNTNREEISYIAYVVSKDGIGFLQIDLSPLSMEIELTDDIECASQFDSINCIKEMLKDSEFKCDSISFIRVSTKTSIQYCEETQNNIDKK